MKTWKNNVFIGILAFFFILSVFSCSENKNKLSGTWELSQDSPYNLNTQYPITIAFSGKNFIITLFPILVETEYAVYWSNTYSFHPDIDSNSNSIKNYIDRDKDKIGEEIFVNSKNIIFRKDLEGKYSISDDKIELIFSDGKINVCSFSRTENTMTIDGRQFIRSKKTEHNKTSKVNINSDSESGGKLIKITEIDSKYDGFWGIELYDNNNFSTSFSYSSFSGVGIFSRFSRNKIIPSLFENGILTASLYNYSGDLNNWDGESYDIWNGTGNYYVNLILPLGEKYFSYVSKKKISFKKNITEIKFSDFELFNEVKFPEVGYKEENNDSEVDIRDAVITVASWWQDYDTATFKPKNESERKELEWRIKAENEFGFKLIIKKVSNYDNYLDFMVSNIMRGNKEYNCYHASPEIAELFYEHGLLYPVSDSSMVDLKNREAIPFVKPSYNSFVEELTTFNYYGTNKSYGWGYGSSSNIDSFYIIPSFISPKEADIILKASEIWNTPVDKN